MMRGITICLLILLCKLSALGQGYFTIIDDDISSIDAVSSVKSIADKYGIKITYAATVSRLQDKELAGLLLQFQEEGHQIVDHGWTHSKDVWGQPRWDVVREELDKSSALLDSLGFRNHGFLLVNIRVILKLIYSPKSLNAIRWRLMPEDIIVI